MDLWETVLGRSVPLTLIEDNESTAAIIRTGRNPTMRHLLRTQGVSVAWLHDLYVKKAFGVVYSRTEAQCADVFTKTFRELPKWQQAIRLIGIGRPGTPCAMPPEPGPRPDTMEKKAKANQPLASGDAAAASVKGSGSGFGSVPPSKSRDSLPPSVEDDWRQSSSPSRALPYEWVGRTEFEVSDGSWRSVEHSEWRRTLVVPARLTGSRSLVLPAGLEWTGWRLTHFHKTRGVRKSAGNNTD